MKLTSILFTVILALNFSPALAENRDFAVLQSFTGDLKAKNYAQARQYISGKSDDLFNKYSQYDLGDLTPGNVKLLNTSTTAEYHYLKISNTNAQGKAGITTVAMVTEDGQPKIDLPESLRLGFGPNWQQKVDMIEKSYVSAKQYFGEQQSRQLLNTLLQKSQQPASGGVQRPANQ